MKCEICKKKKLYGEDTVCGACDRQMELDQLKAKVRQEKAHGARYKCRQCRASLPLSRARLCLKCWPTSEAERYSDIYSETLPGRFSVNQPRTKGRSRIAGGRDGVDI